MASFLTPKDIFLQKKRQIKKSVFSKMVGEEGVEPPTPWV